MLINAHVLSEHADRVTYSSRTLNQTLIRGTNQQRDARQSSLTSSLFSNKRRRTLTHKWWYIHVGHAANSWCEAVNRRGQSVQVCDDLS